MYDVILNVNERLSEKIKVKSKFQPGQYQKLF